MTNKSIRIHGEIAYVPLTRGYEAVIDACDVPIVKCYNWHVDAHKKHFYAAAGAVIDGKPTRIRMHRLLSGADKGQYVDHIDGDGLNNRRDNIRVCRQRDNMRNRKMPTTNSTGYKGVWWDKRINCYRACIRVDDKTMHLGRFDDPSEAHKAYCEAAEKYYGEYSNPG